MTLRYHRACCGPSGAAVNPPRRSLKMKKLIVALAVALAAAGAAQAQTGTAMKESGKAIAEKAKEGKETVQGAATSDPTKKAMHKAKAKSAQGEVDEPRRQGKGRRRPDRQVSRPGVRATPASPERPRAANDQDGAPRRCVFAARRSASSACPAAHHRANCSGVSSVTRPQAPARKSLIVISAAFCRFTRPPAINPPRCRPTSANSASTLAFDASSSV